MALRDRSLKTKHTCASGGLNRPHNPWKQTTQRLPLQALEGGSVGERDRGTLADGASQTEQYATDRGECDHGRLKRAYDQRVA